MLDVQQGDVTGCVSDDEHFASINYCSGNIYYFGGLLVLF